MNDGTVESRLAAMLHELKPKTKPPVKAAVLDAWIAQAEAKLGDEAKGGRLGWLVATSVAVAAIQRAIDQDGRQLFLLKGGTLLQHRLNVTARATKDVDGLVRGDMEAFFVALDDVLAEPWGPLTLRRGQVENIEVPTKTIKPRRFNMFLELRGTVWRRVQFEVSADEAGMGQESETIRPPKLVAFGLPAPDELVGVAIRFQIAQKLHAVSDPHDPPHTINDRPRDVVDLLLLKELIAEAGHPTLAEVRSAAVAVFSARAAECERLGEQGRSWPPTVTAYEHWVGSYDKAATSTQLGLTLHEAVSELNDWISDLDSAG
ncbi:nucleotidyl transferase AbiEii/AbiGii toxin family protein [Kocuria sp.]|uniref:nucleotidyl transferase AbiEii/AbiGii toxin family protein n=1 Tax=Kocuria sp. TaxID=1871328 RepID=UPI0026DF98D7|nr:nucleotidyl transferase AbiEii/AbiGii toxin family protein [Kocuria sp.]MDO5617613.1 nucleotidyl transferase AbiEii/AbiGii toxin family protein [Kocuria sp.]